ncbi:SDR family oxidoreductase [Amphritea balenae]|uniref:SDR family oxidoreductase n=1 Tax=Amphritea balenae TaxID=452629 RepID=A0A3P1SS70_9GAMM|nr:SDR family oxidoreductase [Amphritea balenae]
MLSQSGYRNISVSTDQILIAGCGDIGGQLGKLLIAQGHQVFGLRRNINQLPSGIQGINADLGQPDTLSALPQQTDTVFYIVAAGGREEQRYRQAYPEGLNNLLTAFKKQNIRPRQLFFISSTAVYNQHNHEWIDENSVTEPDSFAGQITLEAEQVALNSGIPATVVRFSGIYGPGRNMLLNQVMQGKGYPAEPLRYSNRIHRDDCVGVLMHLYQRSKEQPLQPVYLASDSEPVPLHEVADWLAQKLNSHISDRTSRRAIGSKRCNNQQLSDSGYQFIYPGYQQGYPDLIRAFLADID